jgi:hypothetical protein
MATERYGGRRQRPLKDRRQPRRIHSGRTSSNDRNGKQTRLQVDACYSHLSVTMGSTLAARRAGI